MARALPEMRIDPSYDRELAGVLRFADFQAAEGTLRRLENLRQHFYETGDKKGIEQCLRVARLGRRRSELISRNHQVSHRKRLEKREIAFWFKVWLETPELFDGWLALRKRSEEFRKLGGSSVVTES